METQAWLDHALECEYSGSDLYHELDKSWQHIGAMLKE